MSNVMLKVNMCDVTFSFVLVFFYFAGQYDVASKVFKIQEATSCVPIESSSTGSIVDYGIKASLTLYVLWISNVGHTAQHIQYILTFILCLYQAFVH